ncbi:MAG TPA: acyltransferase [Anaerolineales bacterium]|nr:acyltransferase [Anaerolineales bacterium]HLO30385.1 acyltransferase [Anaerolineales bacterium]
MQQPEVVLDQGPDIYAPPLAGDRPGSANRHVPALDGLRGIAILLVMLNHFTLYGGMQPTNIIDKTFYDLAVSGWIGVDLFFVLSGFLITGILHDTKESAHFFRNFYARRFLRIFPLYYGVLFCLFIILPRLLSLDKEFQSLIEQQGWYWGYLINLRIALKGWSLSGIIDHFWSLAIEEQFYFFWPIVVFLFSRRNLILICILCILISFGVRVTLIFIDHPAAAHVLTPARMDSLAVGALLALIARGPNGLANVSRWASPIAGFAVVSLVGVFVLRQGLNSEDIAVETIGYALLAVLFGAILTLAVTRAPETTLSKVFATPGLQFFGRYSYALYVFHHPIVFYLKKHMISVEILPRFIGLQLPGQILFILVATSISLVFALLSWHLYEQHFLKLKYLFPYEDRRIYLPGHANSV